MLREEEIRIDTGRAGDGYDFIRFVHVPTGIQRFHPGPLRDVNRHQLIERWLQEIEEELKEKGMTEYIIPDYHKKTTSQVRRKSE